MQIIFPFECIFSFSRYHSILKQPYSCEGSNGRLNFEERSTVNQSGKGRHRNPLNMDWLHQMDRQWQQGNSRAMDLEYENGEGQGRFGHTSNGFGSIREQQGNRRIVDSGHNMDRNQGNRRTMNSEYKMDEDEGVLDRASNTVRGSEQKQQGDRRIMDPEDRTDESKDRFDRASVTVERSSGSARMVPICKLGIRYDHIH